MLENKRYWIIGASAGLGRALAARLSNEGAGLILSARNEASLQDISDKLPNTKVLPLDVTDSADVARVGAELGAIDGIIYVAGTYTPMRAEEWDSETILSTFDVNVGGAVRAIEQVLPQFLLRDTGHIVLIGSLAGYQGLPGTIGYGSSKAALMHLGQCLYADLKKTNIRVQVISPGFIRTRLTDLNDFKMPQIMTPEDAASHVVKAMKTNRFETAFPAPFKWLFTLGKLIPFKLYAKIFG